MAQPNLVLAKKLNTAAWIASAAVLVLVVGMRYIKIEVPIDFRFLPPLHATLNALAAVALMAALYFIKNKIS